jgi:hypothetical protein
MDSPRERQCFGASTGEGISEQGVAGRRLAWVRYGGGNYTQMWLVTATCGCRKLGFSGVALAA